jgi:L-amino acid N-acyltransferase YncA
LCGYCILAPYSHRDEYEITAEVTIYLKPGLTHWGIGGQAIHFLERYAADNGICVLIAVISEENKPSLRLFGKYGYKRCAHFRNIGGKFGRVLNVVICQKELGT